MPRLQSFSQIILGIFFINKIVFTICDTEVPNVTVCTKEGMGYKLLYDKAIDTNVTSIVFHVMACGHVRLIFTDNANTLKPSYEVIIGRDNNSISRIRNCTDQECNHKLETTTPGILHCNEYRSFWVSWLGTINFGSGILVGENLILSKDLLLNITIRFIGIRSRTSNDMWIFESGNEESAYNSDLMCETSTSTTAFDTTEMTTLSEMSTSMTAFDMTTWSQTSTSTTAFDTTEITTLSQTSPLATAFDTNEMTTLSQTSTSTTVFDTTDITTLSQSMNCMCDCSKVSQTNPWLYLMNQTLTKEELLAHLADRLLQLKGETVVNPKTTTAFKARKVSAGDERKSSTVVGWVGILFLSVLFGTMILIDFMNVFARF